MENIKIEEIKKIIEDFFEKLTFEVDTKVRHLENQAIAVKIETSQPKILIGQAGQTLKEIEHLLRIIIRRRAEEQVYLDLDINDYKERRISYLKEVAKSLADEVALTKEERILIPMSSYERRIVHLELLERQDISTQSLGEEPERRVVIKPC